MKVVCISDTHGLHGRIKELPKGDMIIHAGDITGGGNHSEVLNFLVWFNSLDYKYKIFIAGNHDFLFERYPDLIKEIMVQYPDITYLQDEMILKEGKRIYGSPYTPQFGGWAFMRERGDEEHQMRGIWNQIPYGLDLLITHGPAYGVLDKTITGKKAGCANLLVATVREKVKHHVFGHIHEGYGQEERMFTKSYNASLVDEDYELVNKPIVIEI